MFQVDGGRITDPDVLVAADLARAVEGTDGLVVQFSINSNWLKWT